MKINEFVENTRNSFTIGIYSFPDEFEDFLEITKVTKPYKKPLNVMWHYQKGEIKNEKIHELGQIVKNLVDV